MKTQSNKEAKDKQSSPELPIQRKGEARFEDNRSEATVQRKLQAGMKEAATQQEAPIQAKANNTGLPNNLKSGIENLSGFAMDDVKVHYNSDKPAQLKAHAYAQGSDIHLAPGQEKHLAHEAWHVVQQKQGRVKPTRQLKSKVAINDDDGLEKEADVMGAKAMSGGGAVQRKELQEGQAGPGVVQREEDDEWDPDWEPEEEETMTPAKMREVGNSFWEASYRVYVDGLQNREIVRNHKAAIPGAKVFVPAGGKSNRVTYISHGNHSALKGTPQSTFTPPAGMELDYIVPHGYDANATLEFAWMTTPGGRDDFYDYTPRLKGKQRGPSTANSQWADYQLTQEKFHAAPEVELTAQRIADSQNVTVVIIVNPINTSQLIPILSNLGYNKVSPIHCRGMYPDSKEWAPQIRNNLSEGQRKVQERLNLRAEIQGDPGPKEASTIKYPNYTISRADLLVAGRFNDMMAGAITNGDIAPGLVVMSTNPRRYYRIVAVRGNVVYMMGVSAGDGDLLSMTEEELQEEGFLSQSQQERARLLLDRFRRFEGQQMEPFGFKPYPVPRTNQ